MTTAKMPDKECDLIMKGGITSGVVFPQAISTIASGYRLRGIGGTSAGAIGAVVAAAAEYQRQSTKSDAGFDTINRIPSDIGANLKNLFQPSEPLKPLFNLLMRAVSVKQAKPGAVFWGIIVEFLPVFLVFFGLGAIIAYQITKIGPADGCAISCALIISSLAASAILIALVPPLIYAAYRIWYAIARDMPKHHFGLCTGKTQPGRKGPGFTDWMARRIQIAAGRQPSDPPLTIGNLKEHKILLASMTTDLSTGRPYQLPLKTKIHYFSRREFDTLFPRTFVDHLVGEQRPLRLANEYGHQDLYRLPVGNDFPVILVARMSLSFPGLIAAVPLYKIDYTLDRLDGSRKPNGLPKKGVLKRCLFSDGGISSNFPIHFFDSFLPGKPTFGITLAEYEEKRHGTGADARTSLPEDRLTDRNLPVRPITGVIGFAMAIVNTAKDWQDTLQRLLPGYAERIVEVRLAPDQGGLNLDMTGETIEQIAAYGEEAADKILKDFDFDEHRWRRAITTLPAGETVMDNFAKRFDSNIRPSYEYILREYQPKKYRPANPHWREEALFPFAKALVGLGRAAQDPTTPSAGSEKTLPVVDASVRFVASADRVPKANRRST